MAKRKPKSRKGGIIPPPKCKAILLCDQTIIEAGTGKASLIGVFDDFVVPPVPSSTRPCTVFVQLADGIGEHSIEIEVHDLEKGTVLARGTMGIEITWKERPAKHNLIIPMPPIPVSHAGEYDLVIFAGNQEIDRQKFAVVVLLPPPRTQPPEETL